MPKKITHTILIFSQAMELGGVERSLLGLLDSIDYDHYDVDLFLMRHSGELMPYLNPKANLLPEIPQYASLAVPMASLLKSGQIGVLCGRLKGKLAAKRFDKRHPGGRPSVTALTYSHKYTLSAMPQISDKTYDLAISFLTPHYFARERVKAKKYAAWIHTDYAAGMLHIVSVGRLAPEKHFENVIPAAKALRESGTDFVWHIVGEGSERTKLEALIADSGLESHVVLEGSKTNPYPYIKYAQLFVHPSYVESQGLTVLEAMALGVPCVVTKSRGPCEFIQDGINGLLTEQSQESLTARVLEILNDKALYQRIRENTKCPKQFSPERVMKQIEALIDGEKQL